MSRIRGVALFIGISLALLVEAKAATVAANSVSLSDVSSAIGSAHDGDTVTVPAGTASWASTLTIAKGITLQGAGDDKTVIVDDVLPAQRRDQQRGQQQGRGPREEGMRQRPVEEPSRRLQLEQPTAQQSPGATNGQHDESNPRRGGRDIGVIPALMNIQVTPVRTFRLTGFTFRWGSHTTKAENPGCVKIDGTCPGADGTGSLRIDHCHFDQLYQAGLDFHGWIYGVVDHCRWDGRANVGTVQSIVVSNGATWEGGSNDYGDGSWAAPTYFGSEKFLFIEDNIFNNLSMAQTTATIDCDNGGRYVSRHNQFLNCTMITGHGTESGGRHRGQRAIEFYNNTETATIPQSIGITRAGVTIYHHNTFSGPLARPVIPLVVFREDNPYRMFDAANGFNPWDVNDTEGNGTNVPGHAPHLYATGKHTGANASSGTLVSAEANWKPNQWVGYMLTNMTQTTRDGKHFNSRILSNTTDTIVFAAGRPDGPPKTFNAGDGFVIYKLLIALDQPSRGKCDLLAGNPPVNTVTRGTNWPHQALEPIYGWNNTLNKEQVNVHSGYPTLQENRDYYNETKSFDGTAGVGVGRLADRPSNCTPGVGYWATDEGEWDSTHDGPDGQFYVCAASNNWSLYYKPYPYPHPLVSGSARSNVKAGQ